MPRSARPERSGGSSGLAAIGLEGAASDGAENAAVDDRDRRGRGEGHEHDVAGDRGPAGSER